MEARKPKFLNLDEETKRSSIAAIREKINNGFYNSDEVASRITNLIGDIFNDNVAGEGVN